MTTKRLQVLFEPDELAEIKRAARRRRMSVADYVRRALRQARAADADADTRRKLAVIHEAAQYSFPAADIEEMLAEIEQGYSR
jgi:nucleoside-diphosphate-sugar epimerase